MSGGSAAKSPAPPPPPPTPEDPKIQERLNAAAEAERKAKGRASTILTQAGDMGDSSYFKRSLLGR